MRRLMLTLRYDGTKYHGWQVQKNSVTVQKVLQDAIENVTGIRSGVIGCSRTDAGVHADMYCCTTDTECKLQQDDMVKALNANLPRDIAVYDCKQVPFEFHARYSAKGKQYKYRVWNHQVRNPFWEGYALHVRKPLNVPLLNDCAKHFVGTHDFTSFCAANSSVKDNIRTVSTFEVERQEDLVVFTVKADGFLYNMVRIMVGTLLDIDTARLSSNAIPSILEQRTRIAAGKTALACGLILDKVYY